MIFADGHESDKSFSPVTLAEHLQALVQKAAGEGRPLHEVERAVFTHVLKIGFAALEQFLALQGNGDLGATVTTTAGQTLQRSATPVERPLRTVFGRHTLHSYVYAPGPRQKIELRPVEARLGLPPGRYSYLFEEFSQYFCVEQAFGPAAEATAAVLGQKVPVDSLERLNRRLGEQAAEFLLGLPTPPAEQEGEVLVVSADGKGVPLVEREAARVPVFEKCPRPGNRRMATLACVYSVDRYRRTPEEIVAALFREEKEPRRPAERPRPQYKHLLGRFTRSPEPGAEPVTGAIQALCWANEQLARRRQPGQPVIRLMDGQVSLWETAELCLEALAPGAAIDIADILHVAGYVWRAAKVFYGHREQQEAFARERLLRILRGEVRGVLTGLRRLASRRELAGPGRRELAVVCGYLENNAARMRYDEYLREGYPIATGVIEGACRHLVKDRLERSGMRWTLDGAQAMLDVRAVSLCGYWEQFQRWRIAEEQQQLHPHRELLADYVPQPLLA